MGEPSHHRGALAKAPRFVSHEVPLYYQLGGLLRGKILSGEFPVREQIPTEAELAQEYGVSRATVRRALGALEREGLIHCERGRGTFVNEHLPFTGTLRTEGSLDDLVSLGLATEVRVLDLRTAKANPEEARSLGLEPGALLTRCSRLRLYHGVPYSYIVNDFPVEIGRRVRRSDWKDVIIRILQDRLKIPVRDARQSVKAALADAKLAQLLETRIGEPLLAVDHVVMTDGGRPVERTRGYYRSDIYSLTVHLTWSGSRSSGRVGWALEKRR